MTSEALWMDAVERIGEQYQAGRLEFDDAMARLMRLGFDQHEASDMLQEMDA